MHGPRLFAAGATTLLVAATLCLAVAPVAAQVVPGAPQDMLRPRLPTDGKIRFCINTDSMLAEFDREAGQLLADQLLIEANFHDLVTVDEAKPLDYRFIMEDVDLFVEVTNECDALLGYALPSVGPVPDWLTVTRPYFSPPVLLVSRENRAAIGAKRTVGSVIGTPADGQSRSYARLHDEWDRRVYSEYPKLLADLEAGVLDAILIWAPALYAHLGGTLDGSGLSIVSAPFPIPHVELAIGLPSNGVYLRTLLDTAIEGATAQGLFDRLAVKQGLAMPNDGAPTSTEPD